MNKFIFKLRGVNLKPGERGVYSVLGDAAASRPVSDKPNKRVFPVNHKSFLDIPRHRELFLNKILAGHGWRYGEAA